MHQTEMRLDPLTDEWTLFSEARAHQPPAPSVLGENAAQTLGNPFLAGLEAYAAHTLYESADAEGSWRVRVIPNRAPVRRGEGDSTRHGDGFYDHIEGTYELTPTTTHTIPKQHNMTTDHQSQISLVFISIQPFVHSSHLD